MSTTSCREHVDKNEVLKEVWKRKRILCFNYFVRVKSESIKKEIIIDCEYPVDVWFNGYKIYTHT